jgi:hypothetical protein
MTIEDDLIGVTEDEYGPDYQQHVLEIYKLYVEMADQISARRQSANSFYLGINSALVALLGAGRSLTDEDILAGFLFLVPVAGMVLSYLWYRVVRSYKDLNSGKFKVIHAMEKLLPLRSYDAEWTAVGRGDQPGLYLPFTEVEIRVPWVFFLLYLIILAVNIPWGEIFC